MKNKNSGKTEFYVLVFRNMFKVLRMAVEL